MSLEPPKIPPLFSSPWSESSGPPQEQNDFTSIALRALESLRNPLFPSPPPIIQDRWFKDQTLYIDGYTFVGCRFDRCNLVTQWATFVFRNSYFSADCNLYFQGPALKVVQLLMHAIRLKEGRQPSTGDVGLYAHINPDGTFTLE